MSTAAEERAMVARLSKMQRTKLAPHRDRAHWRTWGPDRFYVERLIGEAFELHEKITRGDATAEQVWSEAADVANFAAMLADRYEQRKPSR
jgi:NTP pyrophosphatase (non-canonical NTP hydrolase)